MHSKSADNDYIRAICAAGLSQRNIIISIEFCWRFSSSHDSIYLLVQDQKTCSGMVGATLAVDQGRRKADPYRGNPAYPICVCIRQLRWSERAQAQQLHH